MASSPTPPAAGASSLGDLTLRIDALRDLTVSLTAAYENDETAFQLSGRAAEIRQRAQQLEDALVGIGNALQSLEA